MRTLLKKTLAILLFISASEAQIFAMQEFDPIIDKIEPEVVIYMLVLSGDIKNVATLSLLSKRWHALMHSEFLWHELYKKRLTHSKKLDADKTYKENCKMTYDPVRVYVVSPPEILNHEHDDNASTKIIVDVSDGLSNNIALSLLIDAVQRAFEKNPQIICLAYNCYQGESVLLEYQKNLFDIAKENDILLVLCAGNTAECLSSTALPDGDIHMLYPNALWVTAHDENKRIHHFASYGTLVNLSASSTNGTCNAAFKVAKFLGYMRWLRPDLTADEIRNVLLESVDVTDETKVKIPNGGIHNAIKALENLKKAGKNAICRKNKMQK